MKGAEAQQPRSTANQQARSEPHSQSQGFARPAFTSPLPQRNSSYRVGRPSLSWWVLAESAQTLDGGEPFGRARPMLRKRTAAGAPGHRAQDERHDDGVVGVTQYRDEVRDQVYRQRKVSDEQREADTDTGRQRAIARKTLHESQHVRQQAHRVLQADLVGFSEPQRNDQRCPDQEEAACDADQDHPPFRHAVILAQALLLLESVFNQLRDFGRGIGGVVAAYLDVDDDVDDDRKRALTGPFGLIARERACQLCLVLFNSPNLNVVLGLPARAMRPSTRSRCRASHCERMDDRRQASPHGVLGGDSEAAGSH